MLGLLATLIQFVSDFLFQQFGASIQILWNWEIEFFIIKEAPIYNGIYIHLLKAV